MDDNIEMRIPSNPQYNMDIVSISDVFENNRLLPITDEDLSGLFKSNCDPDFNTVIDVLEDVSSNHTTLERSTKHSNMPKKFKIG